MKLEDWSKEEHRLPLKIKASTEERVKPLIMSRVYSFWEKYPEEFWFLIGADAEGEPWYLENYNFVALAASGYARLYTFCYSFEADEIVICTLMKDELDIAELAEREAASYKVSGEQMIQYLMSIEYIEKAGLAGLVLRPFWEEACRRKVDLELSKS